jgi:hypothetical protein
MEFLNELSILYTVVRLIERQCNAGRRTTSVLNVISNSMESLIELSMRYTVIRLRE